MLRRVGEDTAGVELAAEHDVSSFGVFTKGSAREMVRPTSITHRRRTGHLLELTRCTVDFWCRTCNMSNVKGQKNRDQRTK
jgi:hypothetical protein